MADFGTKDRALALALAAGRTVADAAEHAGLSPRTVHRRLANVEFCRLVTATRAEMLAAAMGKLAAAAGNAAGTLAELATDAAADSVRLNAAKTVLEMANRWAESAEFEQRLTQVEKQLWNSSSGNG